MHEEFNENEIMLKSFGEKVSFSRLDWHQNSVKFKIITLQ